MKRTSPNQIQKPYYQVKFMPTILTQPKRQLTKNLDEFAVLLQIFSYYYPLALLHNHPDFQGFRTVLRQFIYYPHPLITPFKIPTFDDTISLAHEPNWNAFLYHQWSEIIRLWIYEPFHTRSPSSQLIQCYAPTPMRVLQNTPIMLRNRIFHTGKGLIAKYETLMMGALNAADYAHYQRLRDIVAERLIESDIKPEPYMIDLYSNPLGMPDLKAIESIVDFKINFLD